jgi:hypothetical protein
MLTKDITSKPISNLWAVVRNGKSNHEKAFEDAEPTPKQRGRKPKVALEPPPPQEPLENLVSEFLASEASKGLPT